MTFKDAKTEKRYSDALARYTCALHRGTPDRIPIRFFFQEAAARYAGFSNQEVALDYGRAFEAVRKMASDMDADAAGLLPDMGEGARGLFETCRRRRTC